MVTSRLLLVGSYPASIGKPSAIKMFGTNISHHRNEYLISNVPKIYWFMLLKETFIMQTLLRQLLSFIEPLSRLQAFANLTNFGSCANGLCPYFFHAKSRPGPSSISLRAWASKLKPSNLRLLRALSLQSWAFFELEPSSSLGTKEFFNIVNIGDDYNMAITKIKTF